MNIADTMRGFIRRWYIVLPGIILALAAGLGMFITVQPGHERTSTQLLLPGSGIIPVGTTNPYLFLGGLTQAADIVVRVMRSDEVLGPILKDYPGTEVVVERDPTVSGPVVQITVTGKTDAATEQVLAAAVKQTGVELDRLQTQQKVAEKDRISVSTLTLDTHSTLQQKTRILLSAGVVLGIAVLTLIVASLIDGLARRPHKAGRRGVRATSKGVARKRETASEDGLLAGLDDEPVESDHPEADAPRGGVPTPAVPLVETVALSVSADEPGVAFDESTVVIDAVADGEEKGDSEPAAVESAGDDAPRDVTVGAGRGRAHHRAARRP